LNSRLLGDQELLEKAIGLVTLRFGVHTSGGQLAKVSNKSLEVWPCVFLANQRHHLIATKVSREYVIMFVLEYLELKVISLGDIYLAIVRGPPVSESPK